MNEPSEEVKAMARRCAAKYWQTGDPSDEAAARSILSGEWDDQAYTQAAITAILETQRADAALLREIAGPLPHGVLNGEVWILHRCADAIRTGTHYGKDESHD